MSQSAFVLEPCPYPNGRLDVSGFDSRWRAKGGGVLLARLNLPNLEQINIPVHHNADPVGHSLRAAAVASWEVNLSPDEHVRRCFAPVHRELRRVICSEHHGHAEREEKEAAHEYRGNTVTW